MKNVLVTGSEGYIGQHLVEMLVAKGYEVTGCDRCWYDEAFVASRVSGYNLHKVGFEELDSSELKRFDTVCHLAAISNDPMGDLNPHVTLSVNQDKTIEFAESCANAGVGKFLFSSSCSVYGEATEDLVNENSQLNPVSLYAETKVNVEDALTEMSKHGFVTACLRNATAFGHSVNLRLDLVINDFVSRAWTTGNIQMLSDGQAHRPLVHCRDIASAFIAIAESKVELIRGLIINVGPKNANHRVIEMARQTKLAFDNCILSTGEKAIKDTRDYAVDFDKFSTLFPFFNFEYSLEEGIAALCKCLGSFSFKEEDRNSDRFKRLALLRKALRS